MLFVYLVITFIVAFNLGLLVGCLLSSRRISEVAEQKTGLDSELRDLKPLAPEKTPDSEEDLSADFLLQGGHPAPFG